MIGHCKSAAVGELLLSSPRTAKEVAAVLLLSNLKPHEAYAEAAKRAERQKPFEVLDAQARVMAQKLGFEPGEDERGWEALAQHKSLNRAKLYTAVKCLSDHELDELHTLIVALTFGQSDCERLDIHDSFFNRVAQDLKTDMRNHWRPDQIFFEKRSREQLLSIADECGFAQTRAYLSGYKKSELVSCLRMFFIDALRAVEPTPAQEKARAWLPEAMRFPAVDPDAKACADEPDDDAFESEDLADTEGDAPEDAAFEDESLREAA